MTAVLAVCAPFDRVAEDRPITVYATGQSDAQLAVDLLEGTGATAREFTPHVAINQPLQQISQGSGPEAAEPCFAIVICHRQADHGFPEAILEKHRAARIIVLSDCSREQTVVGFLDRGARHFFDIRESHRLLRARLFAALRQHRGVFRRPLAVGDIHFDAQKRQVHRGGRLVQLSPKEYEFANRIFSNIDQVVSNSELMTSVWSLPPHMDTRRIDTAACRVRKKLCLSTDHGWELKRIRRVGYRLSRLG